MCYKLIQIKMNTYIGDKHQQYIQTKKKFWNPYSLFMHIVTSWPVVLAWLINWNYPSKVDSWTGKPCYILWYKFLGRSCILGWGTFSALSLIIWTVLFASSSLLSATITFAPASASNIEAALPFPMSLLNAPPPATIATLFFLISRLKKVSYKIKILIFFQIHEYLSHPVISGQSRSGHSLISGHSLVSGQC